MRSLLKRDAKLWEVMCPGCENLGGLRNMVYRRTCFACQPRCRATGKKSSETQPACSDWRSTHCAVADQRAHQAFRVVDEAVSEDCAIRTSMRAARPYREPGWGPESCAPSKARSLRQPRERVAGRPDEAARARCRKKNICPARTAGSRGISPDGTLRRLSRWCWW
jgi:hypothetical protein